jgi:tRNA nucleotidyltransferase (CCA-adding enzyme)
MDAFAAHRLGDDREDLVVGLASLCHDLGKPATTVESDGRIRSRGHEAAGESPTRSLLGGFTAQESLIGDVVRLVQHHLKPRQLFDAKSGDAAVRRLARKVGRIDRLARVARADSRGRSRPQERWEDDPAADWLEARAAALDLVARAPKPLILGRHLVDRGLSPGPDFGPLLERCFEAQLDGAFGILDEGLLFLDKILRPTGEPPEKN